jgi:hypothetical protein
VTSRPLPPCDCGRVNGGYALFLCHEHAPIPYELTERGHREARKLRQWDAIEATLTAMSQVIGRPVRRSR